MTNGVHLACVGLASASAPEPELCAPPQSRPNIIHREVGSSVARVCCPDEGRVRPEAFIPPGSPVKRRPKALTSKEVSYIHPKPNSALVTDFLIETPKRLEIPATQTKHKTELLSNRDNFAPPSRPDLPEISTSMFGNLLCEKRQFAFSRVIKSPHKCGRSWGEYVHENSNLKLCVDSMVRPNSVLVSFLRDERKSTR